MGLVGQCGPGGDQYSASFNICSDDKCGSVVVDCASENADSKMLTGDQVERPPLLDNIVHKNPVFVKTVSSNRPQRQRREKKAPCQPPAGKKAPALMQTTLDEWVELECMSDSMGNPASEGPSLVLEPWGDPFPDIKQERVLRVLYQNVAYNLTTSEDDPGMSYFA